MTEMSKPGKKLRVYKETAKVQHTTHWDIDYLSLKEVDDLYGKDSGVPSSEQPEPAVDRTGHLARYFRRIPLWVVLLIALLIFGRFFLILVFHLLS